MLGHHFTLYQYVIYVDFNTLATGDSTASLGGSNEPPGSAPKKLYIKLKIKIKNYFDP